MGADRVVSQYRIEQSISDHGQLVRRGSAELLAYPSQMKPSLIKFLLLAVAGWVNREQRAAIEYLREENRGLADKLPGGRRLGFTDHERRRLAVRAKAVRRRTLRGLATIVTPDTLLRWYRQLVAEKYDGSSRRRPGRPRTPGQLAALVVTMAEGELRMGLHADPRRSAEPRAHRGTEHHRPDPR